jgi:hypothetical protein
MNNFPASSLDDFDLKCAQIGDCLTIASLNVQSLNCHFDEVCELLACRNYDILAIAESWLCNHTDPKYYQIHGYDFFHYTRYAEPRGAGVALYAKSHLRASLSLQPVLEKLNFESICCTLQVNGNALPFAIVVAYRNFRCSISQFLTDLPDLFQACSFLSNGLLLLGDININLLHDNADVRRYTSILSSYGLQQLLRQPTRVTATSSSLIDHIVSQPSVPVFHASACDCEISDHRITVCAVLLHQTPPAPQYRSNLVRDFRYYDNEAFLNELFWTPFHRVKALTNVDDMTDLFSHWFCYVADRHAPLHLKSVKLGGPKRHEIPFDPLVAAWQTSKHFYRSNFQRHGRAVDFEQFRLYRSLVKKRVNKLRADCCFAKLTDLSQNPSAIWKEAKRICRLENKRTMPEVDPQSAAAHYSTVGIKTAHIANSNNVSRIPFHHFLDDNNACISNFEFLRVTEDDVLCAFRSLKSNTPGVDHICHRLISDALPAILPILKFIFNASLSTGVFPRIWKHALITPIYKGSGNQLDPISYRPISLLSLFGKLLELVVKPQLTYFIESYKRLPKMQSGFRQRHSAETAVLCISSDIFQRLSKGEIIILLTLDFSKAFDTVSHDILLQKLAYHGVKGAALSWFESYLRPRSQQVNVNSRISSSFNIDTGVPQGSILSPLLYILYTADMPSCLRHASYYSYADDTQLMHSGASTLVSKVTSELEDDFKRIFQWAASNLIKLNAEKTKFIVIKSRHTFAPAIQLNLEGQFISESETMKILGVIFDGTMSFVSHGNFIARKVTGFLQMLAHRRNKLPRQALLLLVNAYVSSQLLYCLSTIGVSASVCDKYQQLQNYAVRVIFGVGKFTHVSALRKQLDWLTVRQMANIKFGVIAHKAIHGSTPEYLRLNLTDFLPTHRYNTRRNDLRLPMCRNKFSEKTFESRAISAYNRCIRKEIWAEGQAAFKSSFVEEIIHRIH